MILVSLARRASLAAANNLPAIWDNRSVFHSATFDYEGLGERFGNRAVGIGEAPYLDPNSHSRTEYLAEKKRTLVNGSGKGIEKTDTISA